MQVFYFWKLDHKFGISIIWWIGPVQLTEHPNCSYKLMFVKANAI